MRKLFWLLLLLLIPGLLARISVGGAGILATDLLVPLFAVIWVGRKVILGEKFPKVGWIGAGAAFVGVAIVSWLVGAWSLDMSARVMSFSYIVRIVSILIVGWSASEMFGEGSKTSNFKLQTSNIFEEFWRPFFLIVGVVVVLGFVQFFLVPDISTWSTEGGWDPHIGRLLGTWLDPNYLAGFLGVMLPLLCGAWYRYRKFWLLALAGLVMVALFLTFSRSGYLAMILGLGLFFLFRDWKVILLAIFVAILGLSFSERAQQRVGELSGTMASIVLQDTAEVDPTAKLRIQNWINSLDLWRKYPVLGIGYNTYRWRAAEEGVVDESFFSAGGADGSHLTVLVTTGVVGFGFYLWFLWSLFWRPFRRWMRSRNELQLGFASGMVVLCVHAVFVNSLFFPLIFLPVIAIAGVLEVEEGVE